MKIIPFVRTMNTRDLGGYPTKQGALTKFSRFIRSDALNHLTPKEVDMLHQLGVATSIDLRTERVADKYRSSLRDDPRFVYVRIPIVEGTEAPLDEEKVPELYMAMLDHHETFRDIMKTIAAAPGSVIYNCSAGKDRTGMVTFLLLELAGVTREAITDDYAISSKLIEARIAEIRTFDPSFPTFLGYSKRWYIEKLFNLFDAKYGNIDAYMATIGVTADECARIRSKLLD